jgi:hypothetical protein
LTPHETVNGDIAAVILLLRNPPVSPLQPLWRHTKRLGHSTARSPMLVLLDEAAFDSEEHEQVL